MLALKKDEPPSAVVARTLDATAQESGRDGRASRRGWNAPHLRPQVLTRTPERGALAWTLAYLVLLSAIEFAAATSFRAAGSGDPNLPVFGLIGHFLLMIGLLIAGTYELEVRQRRPVFGRFLTALSLVSLLRILSLATPWFLGRNLTLFQWLLVLSVPLGLGVWTVLRVTGEKFSDYRFLPQPTAGSWITQSMVVLTGIPLGLAEYEILVRTAEAYPAAPIFNTVADAFVALFAILLATALFEEMVFRGVLQRHATRLMNPQTAVLLLSVVFAVLHIINWSWQDVLFVFGVGWFYGQVVLRTGTLGGVVGGHALVNIMLFILVPTMRAA